MNTNSKGDTLQMYHTIKDHPELERCTFCKREFDPEIQGLADDYDQPFCSWDCMADYSEEGALALQEG
jgi:hypothetical protein